MQISHAHALEWMNDAYAHAIQVQNASLTLGVLQKKNKLLRITKRLVSKANLKYKFDASCLLRQRR
jgi:hypothetical protein